MDDDTQDHEDQLMYSENRKNKKSKKSKKKKKKDQKKREIKDLKRTSKEVDTAIHMLGRGLNRIKDIDDMNLRCYMMLDKFAMMTDVRISSLMSGNIPEDDRENLNYHLNNMQSEITNLMSWVMSERHVPSEVLANPIPESDINDSNSERHRRYRE